MLLGYNVQMCWTCLQGLRSDMEKRAGKVQSLFSRTWMRMRHKKEAQPLPASRCCNDAQLGSMQMLSPPMATAEC